MKRKSNVGVAKFLGSFQQTNLGCLLLCDAFASF